MVWSWRSRATSADKCRTILDRTGRSDDYIEIGLDTGTCYNPLHNDLDPYAVAYAIASLLNNLFGKSKEPFWQQAYTDLLKFVILLRRLTDGYTTLSDVYRYILDDSQIDRDIRRLKAALSEPPEVIVVPVVEFHLLGLQRSWTHWFQDDETHMAHPYDSELDTFLNGKGASVPCPEGAGRRLGRQKASTRSRRAMVSGRMDPARYATSFVDYGGHRCVPLAVRRQPVGAPCVLSASQCLHGDSSAGRTHATAADRHAPRRRQGARAQLSGSCEPRPGPDHGRHVEARFSARCAAADPSHECRARSKVWRDLVFVCDEYHAFATVGETDPTGDERTFALSRQARLIPIVATQSISSLRSVMPGDESWRTLLQCFRNKVFLATSDEFTARNAAELCGKRDRLKSHYSLSESGREAHISLLTGRAAANKHSHHRDQELCADA